MEDIGGVSLAVVVGKVPEVQVNFHEKDIEFHHLNHEITYYCMQILQLEIVKLCAMFG